MITDLSVLALTAKDQLLNKNEIGDIDDDMTKKKCNINDWNKYDIGSSNIVYLQPKIL